MTLDQATAAEAVGPVPPPAETSALAARLGHTSQQLLTVFRAALPIAAAPFVIAAALLLAADAVVAELVAGLDLSCSASSRPTTWYPGNPPPGTSWPSGYGRTLPASQPPRDAPY